MTARHVASLVTAAAAALVVVGLVALPGIASEESLPSSSGGTPTSAPAEPASTAAPTSTTTTPLPPLPNEGLSTGSAGPAVQALEERLVERHYDPGDVDDEFDGATAYAVMAFEKVMGMEPSGKVDPLLWAALAMADDPEPLLPDGGDRRVELDLVRQLLFLYEGGELSLISHTSTGSGRSYCAPGGCGVAITPAGAHRFMWRVKGWRQSRLGRLYNPVYFTGGGVAIHGFYSVPTYPASHGCARIPMHIAEWFPSKVKQGDPVYVFDGETEVKPIGRYDDSSADAPDDGGGPLPPPPEGWLDGQPPLRRTPPTTEPPGHLA